MSSLRTLPILLVSDQFPAYSQRSALVVEFNILSGPADTLFSDSYYHTIHGALKEDGIAASQGECMWLHEELIEKLTRSCKQLFAHVEYSFVTIPTYPCGQIGVLCCSKGRSCHQPVVSVDEVFTSEDQDTLRYYTPDIHTASFVLPRFLAKRINPQ